MIDWILATAIEVHNKIFGHRSLRKYKPAPSGTPILRRYEGVPRIFIFCGKGGVGKTTVSLAVTRILLKTGKIGLLDLDINNPNVLDMLGSPLHDLEFTENGILPDKHNGFEVFSFGPEMGKGTSNQWDRTRASRAALEMLESGIAWSPGLKWLVVDLPPSTADIALEVLKTATPDDVIIVVTGVVPSEVKDTRRTLDMLWSIGIRKPLIVVNRHGYYDSRFNNLNELAMELGVGEIHARVPMTKDYLKIDKYLEEMVNVFSG